MSLPAIKRAEMVTAVALTAVVLGLMLARANYAGGLWRDECAAVQLARMPTFADVLKNFQYEAFPLLFPTIVRGYTNLFGTSDTAFRAFGFAVGALLVAALWFNAWQARGAEGRGKKSEGRGQRPESGPPTADSQPLACDWSPPLLSLALLGLNASVLLYATSVRGYGLGMVFILIVFGLLARIIANQLSGVNSPATLAVRPTTTRLWIAALVVALAAVHCLLYNSVLLAAVGGAAIVVSLLRRNFKFAIGVVALGSICALSMLPYIGPYSSGREWDVLVKFALGLAWYWKKFHTTLGSPWPGLSWIWYLLLAAVMVGGVWRLRKIWPDRTSPEWDLLLMGLLTIGLAVAGYFAFLKVLGYVTYPWYYLALMAILAGALDLLVENLARVRWLRLARLGLALAALIALPAAAWPKVKIRQTNVDLAARVLAEQARPGDLIVLMPWFHGISFNWYYRGDVAWITLPALNEHRTHRYDLVKQKMISAHPIDDVRERVTQTLQGGGRVWLVGDFYAAGPGEVPVPLPPAPTSRFGWSEDAYEFNWGLLIRHYVQDHAKTWGTVKFPVPGPINPMEKVDILMGEGWR